MAVWPICFNRHIHLGLGWLDFNSLAMAWKLGLTWLGSGLSCVLVPNTSTVYSHGVHPRFPGPLTLPRNDRGTFPIRYMSCGYQTPGNQNRHGHVTGRVLPLETSQCHGAWK